MKNIVGFVILIVLLGSCNVLKNSKSNEFNITVIDKEYNTPIDSSKVTLITIIDAIDIYEDVKYTNSHGKCTFKVNYPELAQYQVKTEKDGLLGYLDKSYVNLRAYSFINKETGNDIVLYLTSDSLNHYNYWTSVTTTIEIDSLINLLKSNNYPLKSEFTSLFWEDIPDLLEIGNNTTLINKYPVNPLSSTLQEDCYLGIISLWFIESIRLAELRKTVIPYEKFPSMNPILQYQDAVNKNQNTNSIEIMEEVYIEYLTWWNEVKNMEKDSACRIDPLANINIKW